MTTFNLLGSSCFTSSPRSAFVCHCTYKIMLPISAELQKKNAQRTQSFQLRANYLRTSVELSTSRERLPPQYGVPRNGEWKKGPSSDNPSAPKYPIRDRDSPPPPAAANKLVDAAAILKYSHAAGQPHSCQGRKTMRMSPARRGFQRQKFQSHCFHSWVRLD